MNNSNSTTFWKYLKDNRIVIPIIQRSYAQGRFGKEYLREKFLNNLVNALNGGKPILLDFVYGSESHGCIEPLDGQQRLTTLWLLHWYVALKCGRLAENKETFKHFTYETRVSSRRFTDAICDIEHIDGDEGVAAYIQRRTWFLDAWHNDPTVKAMLNSIIVDGTWEEHVGKIENLGLVSGTDTSVNYVGLPEDTTQWNENFTVEDYYELVQKIYDGEIQIDNSIDQMPEVSVKVNERQGSIM